MTPAVRDRLRQIADILDRLAELGSRAARPLVTRLSALHGEALAAEQDRVLRIAGWALVKHDLDGDVFEDVYARVLDGAQVKHGDARRFLEDDAA